MDFLKNKCIPNISFIFSISLALSLVCLILLIPVHAENLILKDYSDPLLQVKPAQTLLENGTGFFLTTGDSWELYQGYTVNLKSVNQDHKQAWITIENKNESLREGILSEGDIFVYSKDDGAQILNITVDRIYINPDGELVVFKPVYQYLDYSLPEPVIPEVNVNTTQGNESGSSTTAGNSGKTSGFTILQALAGTSVLLVSKRIFKK